MKFKHIPPLAALLTSATLLLQATSCGFIIVNDMSTAEETDALSTKFANPFRTQEVWQIGAATTTIDRSDEQANVLGGQFSKTGKRGH